MKVLKYAIVVGAALGAVSANAQFGAVSKSDLASSSTKQGLYINYSPFARYTVNGGGSSNGYVVSFEKAVSESAKGPGVFGGMFSRAAGANIWDFTYRQYIESDASVGIGVLGGDGFNGKNDFSFLYFKDMATQGEMPLNWQLCGGLYYDSVDKSTNLMAGVKGSYHVSSEVSIDAGFLYLHRGGNSGNLVTVGVGFRV
ncbi:MAG: hypothetical protein JST12_09370 [Armatimonadetes bacterium]|nr:hypothetical protein [Armatimonadota bacterium]